MNSGPTTTAAATAAATTATIAKGRYRKQKPLGPAPIASFDISFESTEEVRLKVRIKRKTPLNSLVSFEHNFYLING